MNEMPYKVPTRYAGETIKYRHPYTMPAELIVAAGLSGVVFPAATFLHTVDTPFEIWDVKLTASQLNGQNVPIAAPAPNLNKFWRVRMTNVTKEKLMTKNAQLVDTLVDSADNIWYWRCPLTIERAEGFEVAVDNLLANNSLRAEITFRGFQIFLQPPSETR